jgi:hypothetical protein
MGVEIPGSFAFPSDSQVPIAVYNSSGAWQLAELEAVTGYTHALIEAERPLFGGLFDRDVSREVAELRFRGINVAFLSHGTDIRSPRTHITLTPWSPFPDDPTQTALLQDDADRNLELLMETSRPIFVSTPDLLVDLPDARWCPVVVAPELWRGGRPLMVGKPVVAHVPSMGAVKGTQLIEQPVGRLHRSGALDYLRVSGVAASEMPKIVGRADIVLDQFRLGSYGVAACEGMAAGRVVVGHVLPSVRAHVREATGLDLPIVEATPETIGPVLEELIADPDRMRELGASGPVFIDVVHSGRFSAQELRRHWIDMPS